MFPILRRFWNDRSGQYAIATMIAMVPIFGALTLGIDYAEMSRQRRDMLNALDASAIATARVILSGSSDDAAKTFAWNFFTANFPAATTQGTTLSVTLPQSDVGGGTLKLSATHRYDPFFLDTFRMLLTGGTSNELLSFSAASEVRLKNTLEVALALDNSGSMKETGTGSGKQRIELLKAAAKQLVDTLADQAKLMKQVAQPVRFSLVPFAGSVNVGANNDNASWMDTTGISPVHQENFDWSTLTASVMPDQYAQLSGGLYYARGSGWDTSQKDRVLTRFSLFNAMQRVSKKTTTRTCTARYSNGSCRTYSDVDSYTYAPLASWGGCVEARPYPYNVNDATPSKGTPATLFVPMFAPDETDRTDSSRRPANNNWWADGSSSTNDRTRQRYMPKYLQPGTAEKSAYGTDEGPNTGCSTKAITKLTDVTNAAGLNSIKDAIDDMEPGGATNVTEGLAWGWRTISSGEPFTEGRGDAERGNDKVVIVLTDGANTYYTPESVTAQSYSGTYSSYGGNDLANNDSIYSAYGYTAQGYNGTGTTRLFMGTGSTVSKNDYSNSNYTKAMNDHFATLCQGAKDGNIILMTVALDLSTRDTAEKSQIDALTACASPSRIRKGSDGKAAKMFWNATGSSLAEDFKAIADELSNLRIVS